MRRYPFWLCLMILRQHLLLYGIILSNYYYYSIQYTISSPPHLASFLSPAFVVRRPSSAACFRCDLVACCLRRHLRSSHQPQSPSDVVALSAVSVWSCHILHRQPSARQHCRRHHRCNPLLSAAHCLLSSRCPPAADSVATIPSLLQPLLLCLPPPALVAPSDR